MAVLDVLEFFDDTGEIMVAKLPEAGSAEFRLGSQLVVQESQVAVFCQNGQFLDGFKPGRHTLTTDNLPLLAKLISLPFGGKSPFRSYVYFVATKTFINLGWGTPTPVLFRDSDFRMISLRAHGAYSMRIVKPRLFLTSLVGTRGLETTFAIEEFFRTVIVSRLNENIGKHLTSILDLSKHYSLLAQETKNAVRMDFEQYGIELIDLLVEAITPPPEVQAMLNRATGVAAQDADKYRAVLAADAMLAAAQQPGGLAGEGVGAGLGFGMGAMMAQNLAATARPAVQTAPAGPPAIRLTAPQIKDMLRDLKSLKDEGLISDSDFEEKKRSILAQM